MALFGSGSVSNISRNILRVRHHNNFFHAPDVIVDACGHRRSDASRLMLPAKIVIHEVQTNCVHMVF